MNNIKPTDWRAITLDMPDGYYWLRTLNVEPIPIRIEKGELWEIGFGYGEPLERYIGKPTNLEVRPLVESDFEAYNNRINSLTQQLNVALEMLRHLLQQFDSETWQCPVCGHAEDTATMDSAEELRDWLRANTKPPANS